MKRINNIYKNCVNIDNIEKSYNKLIKSVKNKRKVCELKNYKCAYLYKSYSIFLNETYKPRKFNVFYIYEPKKRLIYSSCLFDKLINHIVSEYILIPSITNCLIDTNVASRIGYGTNYGLNKYFKYRSICDYKYDQYFILKCDISKFFQSIDHEILKEKLNKKIKDKKAINILNIIINSNEFGLPIGSMSSQILAIFYLNDLDHYIKENLKIKYYVRYQDDFILLHKSKDYLKECLNKIKIFLIKERLELNDKTRIYKNSDKMNYIGYRKDKSITKKSREKRKIKKRNKEYVEGTIELIQLIETYISYEGRIIK